MSIRSSVSRSFRLFLLLAVALMAISVSAQDGGTLIVGTNAPVNLDPASGSNDPEILFQKMIYDTLVDVLPDNSIVPNLADHTVSDDGLTYTFTLADGVSFHDGSALTSADVVYTFNRLQEVQSPALSLLGDFSVSAETDSTVIFTLAAPNADFLFGIGSRWSSILDDAISAPNTVTEGDAPYANFNGTGPFILTDYSPNERAVFERNPNYFKDGQPVLARVEHVYIDDPLAQVDALRTGAVNFIFKVPVDQVSTLESTEGVTVLQVATNQHGVIRLRADEGFAGEDVRIRQALKLATNRDELNEVIAEGRAVVGNNDPIGPRYGAFYDDSLPKPAYDPEAACALIQEATGEARISFDFYVVDALGYPDMATVLQQQWAEGCIDVNLLVRPENVYYGNNEWLDVELGITGWGDRPTPQQTLVEAYITGGVYNETHWSNEALDALVAQAGTTADPEARADLYAQIAQIFADEGPIIVPYFAPVIGATTATVSGLEMSPFPGLTDFREVSVQ